MIRSKGFFWLATRMDANGQWAQAGRLFSFSVGGRWWAAGTRVKRIEGADVADGLTGLLLPLALALRTQPTAPSGPRKTGSGR